MLLLQGHRGGSRWLQRCDWHGLLVVQLHTTALDAVGHVPRGGDVRGWQHS